MQIWFAVFCVRARGRLHARPSSTVLLCDPRPFWPQMSRCLLGGLLSLCSAFVFLHLGNECGSGAILARRTLATVAVCPPWRTPRRPHQQNVTQCRPPLRPRRACPARRGRRSCVRWRRARVHQGAGAPGRTRAARSCVRWRLASSPLVIGSQWRLSYAEVGEQDSDVTSIYSASSSLVDLDPARFTVGAPLSHKLNTRALVGVGDLRIAAT